MKKLALLLLLLAANGYAVISTGGAYELDRMGPAARKYGLGTQLWTASQFGQKAIYSYASSGGAVGAHNLKDPLGNDVTLPAGAIITKCFFDVVTAMASSGGTGLASLDAVSTGDLKVAVDADTLSGRVACIPDGTTANMIKLSTAKTLKLSVTSEALTAGLVNVYVEYALSD